MVVSDSLADSSAEEEDQSDMRTARAELKAPPDEDWYSARSEACVGKGETTKKRTTIEKVKEHRFYIRLKYNVQFDPLHSSTYKPIPHIVL